MKLNHKMKEGMKVAVPLAISIAFFGGVAHEIWDMYKLNESQAVTIQKATKKLAEYDKANKKFADQNKHLKRITEMMASEIDDLKTDKEGLELSVSKLKQDRTLYLDGKVYIARQEFTAEATAYTPRDEEGTADGITATGTKAREGRTIAVDPKVIPLGSIVYIESESPLIGGFYVAEDTGGAIKSNKIDVYMNSLSKAFNFGRQKIKVTVLEGADL